MDTLQKLNNIRTRCVELLAIAEKRTPGKWKADPDKIEHWVLDRNNDFVTETDTIADAAFIASCAGSAEAGWRATIAAIDGLRAIQYEFHGPSSSQHAKEILQTILAVWGEELPSN